MENQFIQQSTKTSCIVASVLSGIALISLVMLLLLMQAEAETKALWAFFISVGLAFVITFWVGILQIHVFRDYKSKRKSLCAEGIFIICLTLLIIITAILFAMLQADKIFSTGLDNSIDIRWFIAIFLLGYSIWKIFVVSMAVKEKRFNWWMELAIAILWLGFSALTITSIFTTGSALTTILWLYVVIAWVLIIFYIIYLLTSYIFKKPDYLVTPEAIDALQKETLERANRIARANAMKGIEPTPIYTQAKSSDDLETKLAKLDNLLLKKVITKEEYDAKRKQIINDSL